MTDTSGRWRHGGPALLGLVLFIAAAAYALSVDIPRSTYGIKSDEATYVASALSAAFDWNLSFERRDLERFTALYQAGPEGIFLKRGKELSIGADGTFPFVHLIKAPDPDRDHLYFGKAFIYPVLAAPLVRVFGLNGMLLFNVVLLAVAGVCAYLFLAARSTGIVSALTASAFLGASVVPVYGVFLMPEAFNFSLVFVAYFFWLYKRVQPMSRLAAGWTDIVAAVLLGVATYSKPLPIGLLVAPLVVQAWLERRWARGVGLGAIAVVAACVLFSMTAAISGEFNYQGGERRTFYGRFPYDGAEGTWERRGVVAITDGEAIGDVMTHPELPARFARNIGYFLVGRHFGFVPYFFPGAVAIVVWMLSRARRDSWRILAFLAFAVSSIVLLLVLPFTWSGGGGPPGNRYLLSVYPVLFFLLPPLESRAPGLLAWVGGALFTVKMLISPLAAAGMPWLTAEKGLARALPIELTMANDLPIMLNPSRSRIAYGHDPMLLLYFLDQHAFPPEPRGMWVAGSGRADVIVRSADPLDHVAFEAESPIRTMLTISLGGEPARVPIEPGKVAAFDVPVRGLHGWRGYVYLLTASSSQGFIPRLQDAASVDQRNLGVQLRFQGVLRPAP